MQISVAGQHITVGVSLNDYVKDRAEEVVKKYFENAISAHVHFSKQGFQYTCNIVVNDGVKHVIKSESISDEIYTSFDVAIAKVEKQLRKYKSRLKDRQGKIKVSEVALKAMKYVISPYQEEEADIENGPLIIAEKPTEIAAISVSEAVMKMDLENLPALMFKNSKTNRINVVYYRKDGNISWVDSK